jgi:hypothetical protein
MTILVQFSTGAGSAEVAVRCIDKYGLDNVHLISADTAVEDEDNWRLLMRYGNGLASRFGIGFVTVAPQCKSAGMCELFQIIEWLCARVS